ncbi:MAG: hypothetical protein R3D26_07255 [Cyanobacteriota/Melainabacteria group bacterium]
MSKREATSLQVEIDLEASDEMLSDRSAPHSQMPTSSTSTADPSASPSATSNRIQAARRRNTSTFTKLQALSASGTGSVSDPETKLTESSGDLRSLLDRLDTDEKITKSRRRRSETGRKSSGACGPETPEPQIQPKPVAQDKAKFEAPENSDYPTSIWIWSKLSSGRSQESRAGGERADQAEA